MMVSTLDDIGCLISNRSARGRSSIGQYHELREGREMGCQYHCDLSRRFGPHEYPLKTTITA
jgi:hypothetical protein